MNCWTCQQKSQPRCRKVNILAPRWSETFVTLKEGKCTHLTDLTCKYIEFSSQTSDSWAANKNPCATCRSSLCPPSGPQRPGFMLQAALPWLKVSCTSASASKEACDHARKEALNMCLAASFANQFLISTILTCIYEIYDPTSTLKLGRLVGANMFLSFDVMQVLLLSILTPQTWPLGPSREKMDTCIASFASAAHWEWSKQKTAFSDKRSSKCQRNCAW